jgi:ABC-type transporter Mla maintaining outer membrane lipid asymmetry ATPase subunit MlaF
MPLIEIRDLVKHYGGMRPFRLTSLSLDAGESVTIDGPEKAAAAVLTDLITGTTLPDTGTVVVDARPTSQLDSQEEWLAFLDRFGIVNERVVLLDELSIAQNLAVPLTLDIDPLPSHVRAIVESLAREVGLAPSSLAARVGDSGPASRWLVRLGRALAASPAILLIEHPTADLGTIGDVAVVADAIRRVLEVRRPCALLTTCDPRLPRGITARSLQWQAATGETSLSRGWRRWFS